MNIVDKLVQWQPNKGSPPSESTYCYLLCNKQTLYIAFQCFNPESEKIAVYEVTRDRWDGDHVWVILDTFGDKMTAYEFCVNSAGVQLDVRISQEGELLDISWDGIWYSATKITDYGYNVEMKIPFKTLKFKLGLTE